MATSNSNSTLSTLDELVATAQAAVTQSIESAKAKQANAAKAEGIAAELSSTLKVVAGDVAIVNAAKNAAELKTQAVNSQIARAAGIDPEAGANILVDTVTKLRQSNAEVETNLKEYRRKNEAGFSEFISSPLQYITDRITLPATEAKLKGSAEQAALYSNQLTKVNETLQTSFQTTEKLKESMTTASAAAATRVAAAASLIESQKYSLEALKYNTEGIQAAQNATAEQLNYIYNVFNAKKSEEQLQLQQSSNALSRDRFEFEKSFKQDQLEAKAAGKQLDDVILNKMNIGRASVGMQPLSGPEAQFALAKMKSGAGGDVQTYYEIGDKASSTGTGYLGNTPAEALRTLQTTATNLPDLRKDTSALLAAAAEALQQSKSIDHKDKSAVDGFVNKFVKDQIDGQYRSISPGSDNLFNIGDLSSYLTLSTIAALPVTQKVLAPLAAAKVELNDPKLVLGFMQKAVKDGTLTTAEIAGLATVYRQANLINQQARDFKSLGIIPPNAGRNYNAKVSTFGKPLDMTDPTAITNHLSRQLSEEFFSGAGIAGARGSKL